FKYIDRADILKSTRPESLLLLERTEFGPAIVHPVALETPAGRVEASEPGFEEALKRMIERGNEARKKLLRIERREIGAISRELESLGIAEKAGHVAPPVAEKRRAELQTDFNRL